MPAGSREECEAAAKTLLQKGVGTVLVSIGAKGALAVTPHGSVLMPPPKVKAVDSTSAGDCFTAAFVSRWDGGLATGAPVCQRCRRDCRFEAGRPGIDPVGGGSGRLYPIRKAPSADEAYPCGGT